MAWIINGVYIPDDDCISEQRANNDNIKKIPSNLSWNI